MVTFRVICWTRLLTARESPSVLCLSQVSKTLEQQPQLSINGINGRIRKPTLNCGLKNRRLFHYSETCAVKTMSHCARCTDSTVLRQSTRLLTICFRFTRT